MEHIAILRPNMPKFLISVQDPQFSNIRFKINELDLLWVPNFLALEIYFIFGTTFFWNDRLILVLMSNVCYLVIILIILVVTWWLLLVTYWLLFVTWWLLLVTVHYWWLLLVPIFSMNAAIYIFLAINNFIYPFLSEKRNLIFFHFL